MMQTVSATPATDRAELLADIGRAIQANDIEACTLFDLAEKARKAAAQASLFAATSRQRALNPALPQDEVKQAREDADAAAFDAERMTTAIDALENRAMSIADEAEAIRRNDAYENAIAERDRCAERIRAEYPSLQKQLIDLLADLAATNALVDRANHKRPEGAAVIQRPEGAARGFDDRDNLTLGSGAPYNGQIFRILQAVLPDFQDRALLAWPSNQSHHAVKQRGITLPSYRTVQECAKASCA